MASNVLVYSGLDAAWSCVMANMQREVYEAFRSIDIPDDKAVKAAGALAKRGDDVSDIKWDLAVLKWMVGTLYPLVVAILLKLFIH